MPFMNLKPFGSSPWLTWKVPNAHSSTYPQNPLSDLSPGISFQRSIPWMGSPFLEGLKDVK